MVKQIVVFEEDNRRVVWNGEATFHLERKIGGTGAYFPADIMTSYGSLGIEDAQERAKWWINQMEIQTEEQKDVE